MAIVLPRQYNIPQLNSTQLRLDEDHFHGPLDHISNLCNAKPAPDLLQYRGHLAGRKHVYSAIFPDIKTQCEIGAIPQ
jgi:hypothetical protein